MVKFTYRQKVKSNRKAVWWVFGIAKKKKQTPHHVCFEVLRQCPVAFGYPLLCELVISHNFLHSFFLPQVVSNHWQWKNNIEIHVGRNVLFWTWAPCLFKIACIHQTLFVITSARDWTYRTMRLLLYFTSQSCHENKHFQG